MELNMMDISRNKINGLIIALLLEDGLHGSESRKSTLESLEQVHHSLLLPLSSLPHLLLQTVQERAAVEGRQFGPA
jgi:hypothetical protein